MCPDSEEAPIRSRAEFVLLLSGVSLLQKQKNNTTDEKIFRASSKRCKTLRMKNVTSEIGLPGENAQKLSVDAQK